MIKLANPLRIHYCYFHSLSLNDDRPAIEKGKLLAFAWELSSFLSNKVPTFVFSPINNKSGKAAADGANAVVSKNNAILIECPIDIANAALHLVILCCN